MNGKKSPQNFLHPDHIDKKKARDGETEGERNRRTEREKETGRREGAAVREVRRCVEKFTQREKERE